MPEFPKSTGYKMNPLPMIEGTLPHKSALKAVDESLIQAAGSLTPERLESTVSKNLANLGEDLAKAFGDDDNGDDDKDKNKTPLEEE